ncbi:polysaccharide deacetylase family protein [Arthrobacter sp. TMT4-20]
MSLTFDDANDNQIAAAATLQAKGLRGTFFIPSGYLDAPSYLTTAEVQVLQADGHEIGGHSVTHPDLAATGVDEAKRQVCNDRVNLINKGLNITSFAYPFASSSLSVETIVRDCGYNSARGLGDVRSKNPDSASYPVAETIPPANPYNTGAPEQVDNTWTLADLQNTVTQSVNGSGGWVQLTFHHVGLDGNTLSVSDAIFAQFTTWLAEQVAAGTIEVKTVHDVVGGATQPAVSGPAAPAPITTGNLLKNPSLETPSAIPGLPSCWSIGTYGANSPTFTRVTPGRTGAVAQQLTMAEYVDGDAKLLPTLDLGECAPSADPGRSYEMKAWYQSTAPTQFALYYRTGLGTWNYWTSSPLFDAAVDWTEATWTSPPVPAGASAISMGLNLISNGTLITDDYELTAAGTTHPAPTPVVPAAVVFIDEDGTAQDTYTIPATVGVEYLVSGTVVSAGTHPGVDTVTITARATDGYVLQAGATTEWTTTFSAAEAPYTPPAVSPFADVSTSQLFYKEIAWLAGEGISTGWAEPNGTRTYRALQPVNRDAMAAFLYRAGGSPPYTPPAVSPFADVSTSQLFYKEMSWLASEGISTGWDEPNGTRTYRALQPVNRDAMAAFLFRAINSAP